MKPSKKFIELVDKLQVEYPSKKRGGFLSAKHIIEYKNHVDQHKIAKDLNLPHNLAERFVIAGKTGNTYEFGILTNGALLFHSTFNAPTSTEPKGNHEKYILSEGDSHFGWNKAYTYQVFLNEISSIVLRKSNDSFFYRLQITHTNGEKFEADLNIIWEQGEFFQILTKHVHLIVYDKMEKDAKRHEELLEFEQAAQLYKKLGRDDKVIRLRKKQEIRVDQTVVHGDYVDDRDTIVKDSVINRSNVGSGGYDKLTKIKELKELHDAGVIDDDEFKQMKKEILGK